MIQQVVTLRRRALPRWPGEELRYSGQTIEPPVKPDPDDPDSYGLVTLTEDVAHWVFSRERFMAWTDDGRWVHRFGIERASKGFLAALGRPEAEDISPITLDTKRLEHSNTSLFPSDTLVTQLHVPPPRDRQPAGNLMRG